MSLSSGCEAPGNTCLKWITIPDNIQCPGATLEQDKEDEISDKN